MVYGKETLKQVILICTFGLSVNSDFRDVVLKERQIPIGFQLATCATNSTLLK